MGWTGAEKSDTGMEGDASLDVTLRLEYLGDGDCVDECVRWDDRGDHGWAAQVTWNPTDFPSRRLRIIIISLPKLRNELDLTCLGV